MGELPNNSTWSAHDVLGRNPFPEGDPRPQYWTNVSLWVSERLAKFSSVILNALPAIQYGCLAVRCSKSDLTKAVEAFNANYAGTKAPNG
jgi:hypothetical protein